MQEQEGEVLQFEENNNNNGDDSDNAGDVDDSETFLGHTILFVNRSTDNHCKKIYLWCR